MITKRFFNYTLLSLLTISLVLNVIFINDKYNSSQTKVPVGVKVVGVIDGDTLVLDGKSRIRLRHADAPELDNCGGREAKKTLEKLVIGQFVKVDEQIADKYGRGMALIYIGNLLVNDEMLKSGWARYHSDITSQENLLKTTSSIAKNNHLGIYGLCQTETNTQNPKCVIKGNIDKNSSVNNKKYYLQNCAQYKFTIVERDVGEDWFCTEKEAKEAGFTKAETCK